MSLAADYANFEDPVERIPSDLGSNIPFVSRKSVLHALVMMMLDCIVIGRMQACRRIAEKVRLSEDSALHFRRITETYSIKLPQHYP
jgi:hypothetical protein